MERINPEKQKIEVNLVETVYACHGDMPMIWYNVTCDPPCLSCDLYDREIPDEMILASGLDNVEEELCNHDGAYLFSFGDGFLPAVRDTTHELIRFILEETDRTALMITKHLIPKETIDLLSRYPNRYILQYSVPSDDENLVGVLEPGAAPLPERYQNIRELTAAGVEVSVTMMPIPDEDLGELPKKLYELDVRKAIVSLPALAPRNIEKYRNSGHSKLERMADDFTEFQGLHTRNAFLQSDEYRRPAYESIISQCAREGIRASVCGTVLNPDYVENDHGLRVCTGIRVPSKKR